MIDDIIKNVTKFTPSKSINDVYLDWGEQHWIQLEPDVSKVQPIVSTVTIYPMQEQLPHKHFGYHEIIIGLKGKMVHWCDNRKINLDEGTIGYISNESAHHFINFSSEPVSFISIIYSAIPKSLMELSTVEHIDFSQLAKRVNVNLLVEKFILMVHMKIFLVDAAGKFMVDEKFLPNICKHCIQDSCGDCMLADITQVGKPSEGKIFQCRFGVSVYQTPIVVNNMVLGYLSCGYGKLSEDAQSVFFKTISPEMKQAYYALPFISLNQLTSVAETLSLISTSFVRLMINHIKEEELSEYKINLAEERETQMQLCNTLNQTQLKFLESQVNPHFLFNTLNTIAQQAEMDGAEKIASLTYALSNLLRLSLGKAQSLVAVKEELDYIKDYLFIQQSRFPDKFKVSFTIDKKIFDVKIPFMTIMVLVENSILHGFKNITYQGLLKIAGYVQDNHVVIEVKDNGSGISNTIISVIQELPHTDYNQIELKGIGIKNIFLRLKHYYGGDFSLSINKSAEGGTLARIQIPF
jgi:sensor histidine kinase YesM